MTASPRFKAVRGMCRRVWLFRLRQTALTVIARYPSQCIRILPQGLDLEWACHRDTLVVSVGICPGCRLCRACPSIYDGVPLISSTYGAWYTSESASRPLLTKIHLVSLHQPTLGVTVTPDKGSIK